MAGDKTPWRTNRVVPWVRIGLANRRRARSSQARTANGKVRQRAVHKALRDAAAADDLLADAGDHLRDVDLGALGAALGHDERAVVLVQLTKADLTGVVANARQLASQFGLFTPTRIRRGLRIAVR